jgi:DNA-binding response OmpR family regulator
MNETTKFTKDALTSDELLPEAMISARILIIDDINFYGSLVKQVLDNHGFEGVVEYATSIKSAVDKIKESLQENRPFDLIITDLHLPDGKGTHLAKKIRTNKQMENIPIIIISTDSAQAQIINAITEFGIDTYLVKPLDSDDFFEKIKFAWNKRHP